MKTFETWFNQYFDDAVENYGGVDCSNPQGIAENAWNAATEQSQARIAELEAENARLKEEAVAFASNLRGKHTTTGATYAHLRAQLATITQERDELEQYIDNGAKYANELTERLTVAEKDAQRYQFIREDYEDGNECAWFAPLLYEEELDDAIDAAIAAHREAGK